MKIIYIPGFGGNQNSETFKKISEKYFETEFIIYDNRNAEKAYQQILKQTENKKHSNVLIIGQSLGGFWAEILAFENNWNTILINPSLEPYESLKKYQLSDDELSKFKNYKLDKIIESKISIILSKNDTIVNPKPVIDKYGGFLKFKYIDGDHKLENFEVLFKEIEKMKT